MRALREKRGLTQMEIGLRCGWSQSRYANYETPIDRPGARSPDLDDVPTIASALDVSIGELFGEPPIQSQSVGIDAAILARAIESIEVGLDKAEVTIDPAARAEIAIVLYHQWDGTLPSLERATNDALAAILKANQGVHR